MTRKMSRAEKAGRARARSIVEDVQMMYNKRTKKNYLTGVMNVLTKRRIEKNACACRSYHRRTGHHAVGCPLHNRGTEE